MVKICTNSSPRMVRNATSCSSAFSASSRVVGRGGETSELSARPPTRVGGISSSLGPSTPAANTAALLGYQANVCVRSRGGLIRKRLSHEGGVVAQLMSNVLYAVFEREAQVTSS